MLKSSKQGGIFAGSFYSKSSNWNKGVAVGNVVGDFYLVSKIPGDGNLLSYEAPLNFKGYVPLSFAPNTPASTLNLGVGIEFKCERQIIINSSAGNISGIIYMYDYYGQPIARSFSTSAAGGIFTTTLGITGKIVTALFLDTVESATTVSLQLTNAFGLKYYNWGKSANILAANLTGAPFLTVGGLAVQQSPISYDFTVTNPNTSPAVKNTLSSGLVRPFLSRNNEATVSDDDYIYIRQAVFAVNNLPSYASESDQSEFNNTTEAAIGVAPYADKWVGWQL